MTISMRWQYVVNALFAGALATSACGGSGAAELRPVTAASSSEDEAIAGLKEYHRYHHHGGVALFVAMSLDTLAVSPEEHTAVEKIRMDLVRQLEPARIAEQGLMLVLANALAIGQLDRAKLDTKMMEVRDAARAVHGASVTALNELHRVLSPSERAALVDKVFAHWAVSKTVNDQETLAEGEGDGHLATLTRDLDLTPDQVAKIRAGLGERGKSAPPLDPDEIGTELRAFGDAFRSDTFDATALTAASDANAHVAGWGAAHLANFVETALLVLTPEQRTELANRLREHASHSLATQGGSS